MLDSYRTVYGQTFEHAVCRTKDRDCTRDWSVFRTITLLSALGTLMGSVTFVVDVTTLYVLAIASTTSQQSGTDACAMMCGAWFLSLSLSLSLSPVQPVCVFAVASEETGQAGIASCCG